MSKLFTDYDINKTRPTVFTEYGTTNVEGRKLFKECQRKLQPMVEKLCDDYQPHEVQLIMNSVVALETTSYGATLFHLSSVTDKRLKDRTGRPKCVKKDIFDDMRKKLTGGGEAA